MSYNEQMPAPQYSAYQADPKAGGAMFVPQDQGLYLNKEAAGDPETPKAGWFSFRDSGYVKGFVVGASVALVLSNPTVQKTLLSGAVKLWNLVQGGVEEVKEQVKDIKAEISSKE